MSFQSTATCELCHSSANPHLVLCSKNHCSCYQCGKFIYKKNKKCPFCFEQFSFEFTKQFDGLSFTSKSEISEKNSLLTQPSENIYKRLQQKKPKGKPFGRAILLALFLGTAIFFTVMLNKMNNCYYYGSYNECNYDGTMYCCHEGIQCPVEIEKCSRLVNLQNQMLYVVAIGMVVSYIFVIGISISLIRFMCKK